MMRDLAMAMLLLALAGAPFGTAADAGLVPLCSLSGVRWVDRDSSPAAPPADHRDGLVCAHLLQPSREKGRAAPNPAVV